MIVIPPPEDRLVLIGDWVCRQTGECTCGVDEPPHEELCGYEQVMKVDHDRHDTLVRRYVRRMGEHVIQVGRDDKDRLIEFMRDPNGSHWVNDRLTVEAVEGGGVLIRTRAVR